MADAPTLSPDVSRSVSVLARSLVAAARSWALYPPDHPAVRSALDRLRGGITEACAGQSFSFGVALEEPMLVNTWEPDGRGDYTWAVVEAVDPDAAGIDPLHYM
jgi:hypothetical protein